MIHEALGIARGTAKVAGKEAGSCEGACPTDFSSSPRDVIFTSDLQDRIGSLPGAAPKINN